MKYITFYNIIDDEDAEGGIRGVFWADVGYDEEKNDIVVLKEKKRKGTMNMKDFLKELLENPFDEKGRFSNKDRERFFNSLLFRFKTASRTLVTKIREK